MKLSRLSLKNFLGIREVNIDLKKINYLQMDIYCEGLLCLLFFEN